MTRRAPSFAAAAVAAGAALVLLIAGRETWFYLDEWDFSLRAADLSLDAIMNPNNQNWHGTVVLLYRALFELFGFDGYVAFRLVGVALVVTIGVLGYLYARPRIGPWWALLPLALLAVSPSFEVQLWPFQIGQLLSGACGLGALLLLDREPTRASLGGAAALLVVAVASSSAAIPLLAVVIYDRLLTRERRREVLVALPAVVVYGLWYLEYAGREPRPNKLSADALSAAADKAFDVAHGNITALLGLTSQGSKGTLAGQIGVAILVVVVCWRIFGGHSEGRTRVIALAGGLVTYWSLLAWGRPFNEGLGVSGRYVFVAQILLVLLLVEVAVGVVPAMRDRRLRLASAAAVVVVMGLALIHNVRTELDFGGFLRQNARAMEGQVYGLALLPPDRRASAPIHLEPLGTQIPRPAGAYFDLFDRFGGPAPTEPDARALPSDARARADQSLMLAFAAPQPTAAAQAGSPPEVTAVVGGAAPQARADGSCATVRSSGGQGVFELTPPPAGVAVSNMGPGPLTVQVRRYASDWLGPARADVAEDAPLTLRIAPVTGAAPWRIRLVGEAARVCSLAA